MEPARSEEWGKKQLKIVFLSPPDSPDTLVLPEDIDNASTTGDGRRTAFTQGQLFAIVYGWGRWYPVEHVLIVAARTEPALSRPSPLRSRSEEQIS
jgi:hypothetical protein